MKQKHPLRNLLLPGNLIHIKRIPVDLHLVVATTYTAAGFLSYVRLTEDRLVEVSVISRSFFDNNVTVWRGLRKGAKDDNDGEGRSVVEPAAEAR